MFSILLQDTGEAQDKLLPFSWFKETRKITLTCADLARAEKPSTELLIAVIVVSLPEQAAPLTPSISEILRCGVSKLLDVPGF